MAWKGRDTFLKIWSGNRKYAQIITTIVRTRYSVPGYGMKDKTLVKGDFIYDCTWHCASFFSKQIELLSKYKKILRLQAMTAWTIILSSLSWFTLYRLCKVSCSFVFQKYTVSNFVLYIFLPTIFYSQRIKPNLSHSTRFCL